MRVFLYWLDDKTLVIITILVFGLVAILTKHEGALILIEKLSYGLLGMAVGKGMKK